MARGLLADPQGGEVQMLYPNGKGWMMEAINALAQQRGLAPKPEVTIAPQAVQGEPFQLGGQDAAQAISQIQGKPLVFQGSQMSPQLKGVI